MIRTQIQLTEQQYDKIKELARQQQISVASIVRTAVDQLLVSGKPSRDMLYGNAVKVIGKYRAGQPDISVHHDRYLGEDFS